ncbi:hypothetical protein ACHAWF_001893 [Thalassiosira exigua]
MICTNWLRLALLGSALIPSEGGICTSQTQCEAAKESGGYNHFYADDYSYADSYGCFEKNGNVFWGRGGNSQQIAATLTGRKARMSCGSDQSRDGGASKEQFLPAESGAAEDREDNGAGPASVGSAATWCLTVGAVAWANAYF